MAGRDGGDANGPLPTGDYACSRAFSGTGGSLSASTAIDDAGDLIVFGGISGSVDLGGGAVTASQSMQPFIAKYGPTCEYKWAQTPSSGATGQLAMTSNYPVRVDASGNIFAILSFSGTITLAGTTLTSANGGAADDLVMLQYSGSGTLMAARRLGGPAGENIAKLAIDRAGNLLTTGVVSGAVDLGTGMQSGFGGDDIFIAKYSPAGVAQWAHVYGTASGDSVSAIATDKDGNALIVGSLKRGTANLGGAAFSVDSIDWFVAKYGADGSYKWARHFQMPSTAVGPIGVAAAPDGSVLVTGAADGISDLGGGAQGPNFAVVLVKYSPSGAYQFEKRFAITGFNLIGAALHVVSDDSGNITLAGETQAAGVDFGGGPLTHGDTYDVFVVKLRADGSYLWGQRTESISRSFAHDLALGRNGHFAIAGAYRNSLNIGGQQHMNNGSLLSGYLVHYLP